MAYGNDKEFPAFFTAKSGFKVCRVLFHETRRKFDTFYGESLYLFGFHHKSFNFGTFE